MVKYLLSCDGGGGIRGVVAAQFLAELERDLGFSVNDRFDLLAGANTGAVTVLAIATEQLPAKDVVERIYSVEAMKKLMEDQAGHPGLVHSKPQYSGPGKTSFLKQKFSTMRIHSAPKVMAAYFLLLLATLEMGFFFGVSSQKDCRHFELHQ